VVVAQLAVPQASVESGSEPAPGAQRSSRAVGLVCRVHCSARAAWRTRFHLQRYALRVSSVLQEAAERDRKVGGGGRCSRLVSCLTGLADRVVANVVAVSHRSRSPQACGSG
jgi:hypothetical protein